MNYSSVLCENEYLIVVQLKGLFNLLIIGNDLNNGTFGRTGYLEGCDLAIITDSYHTDYISAPFGFGLSGCCCC